MKTFEFLIYAPIPVGHRVEIKWYKKIVRGLLSGEQKHDCPHHPVVKDMDTGITYGDFDLFWKKGAAAIVDPDEPTALEPEVLPEFPKKRELKGKVAACRVATYSFGIGSNRMFKVQTTLVVEPE